MPMIRRNIDHEHTYVTIENGIVSVTTPKECTGWDHDFRLRIIRDYRAPRSLLDKDAHRHVYDPAKVYKVSGARLQFRQVMKPVDNFPTKIIMARNEVVHLDRNQVMILAHDDPAMRVLMVYAFLRDKSYNGVASFATYTPEDKSNAPTP